MPRFAILNHDHPFPHWDLLLEWGARARTWRLLDSPALARIPVEALPDHRLLYLDYEGPVSGGRGQVTGWDRGEYLLLQDEPQQIIVRLHGQTQTVTATITAGHLEFQREPQAGGVCPTPPSPADR